MSGAEHDEHALSADAGRRIGVDTVEALVRKQLATALGGRRGMLEAAVPGIIFTVLWLTTDDLRLAHVLSDDQDEIFQGLVVKTADGHRYAAATQIGATLRRTSTYRTVMPQLRAVPGRGLGYGALRYLTATSGLADRPAATLGPSGPLSARFAASKRLPTAGTPARSGSTRCVPSPDVSLRCWPICSCASAARTSAAKSANVTSIS